jgi:hypothetical protein
MSNIDNTDGFETSDAATTGKGRKAQVKQVAGQAAEAIKTEAQSFAQTAQERLRTEAQKRTETATRTLGDFAGAIRRAGDELSQNDHSPAARLVGQAADGLERLSLSLADKQPEDLLNSVRDFGRKHPMAFIAGAALVGVALGRFVRASDAEGADPSTGFSPAYPIAQTSYGDETELGETSSFAADDENTLTAADGTDAELETAGFDSDVTDIRDINTTGAGVGHADDDVDSMTPSTTPRPGM